MREPTIDLAGLALGMLTTTNRALTAAAPCTTCAEIKGQGGFGPSHNGSPRCESGSIASGGTRAHCSCAVCF